MSGIYIHIPFCESKCPYCDFVSYAGKPDLIGDYLKTVENELESKVKLLKSPDTLYIGGGTPSFLSNNQIKTLFLSIEKYFGAVSKFREITFEVNPESVSAQKMETLKKSGVNRISVGFQTSDSRLLKKLGRLATFDKFLKTYRLIRSAGFRNVNIDIIGGIPSGTMEIFKKTLKTAVNLRPSHISLYSLEIHKGTAFYKNKVKADDELAYLMYETARKFLKKNGYSRYEISNFAKKGAASLHNLNYWNNGEYIGLGPSAVSYVKGRRSKNTPDLKKYINSLFKKRKCPMSCEKLTGREKIGETIILGLRKTDGIELSGNIFIKFKEEIEKLLKLDLIEIKRGRMKIKENRFYVSNKVFFEFV